MKRIVYLLEQPLDPRNFERFGIQAWLDHGWQVEVWDLTPWAHPKAWAEFQRAGHRLSQFSGNIPIHSYRELQLRLAQAAVGWFVDVTGESYYTLRAKRALCRSGAVRVTCELGAIPVPAASARVPLRSRLREILAKGPRGALEWFRHAIFLKVIAPRIPLGHPVAVVGGEISLARAGKHRQAIHAHNFDYDIFLRAAAAPAAPAQRYVVFIDQDYCFHPEFIYQHSRPVVTPERYFPAVRAGLAAVAAALDVSQVKIAAHPRSAYLQRSKEFFADFTVESGKTAELIRGCTAVVCHDSTAIQFAVLFAKPMIFVTTEQLDRVYEGRSIAAVAAQFGKVPVNLDRGDLQAVDWHAEMQIDAARYADYRKRYIKMSASPDRPLWEIVIEQLGHAGGSTKRL
jgi:hypothetical protein